MVMTSKSPPEFTEIPLDTKKLPKRRVYFSDGYLDEYSTDEEVDCKKQDSQPIINTKEMGWLPYLSYLTLWVGGRALAVCDYLGEHLAYYLGITTPKFQYELDQCKSIMEEEEALKKKLAEDNAGWGLNSENITITPIQLEPIISENKDKERIVPIHDSQNLERY